LVEIISQKQISAGAWQMVYRLIKAISKYQIFHRRRIFLDKRIEIVGENNTFYFFESVQRDATGKSKIICDD
jgi:hypothetical protein